MNTSIGSFLFHFVLRLADLANIIEVVEEVFEIRVCVFVDAPHAYACDKERKKAEEVKSSQTFVPTDRD